MGTTTDALRRLLTPGRLAVPVVVLAGGIGVAAAHVGGTSLPAPARAATPVITPATTTAAQRSTGPTEGTTIGTSAPARATTSEPPATGRATGRAADPAQPRPGSRPAPSLRSPTPVRVAGFNVRHPVVDRGHYGPLRLGMSYEAAMRTGWIDRDSKRPNSSRAAGDCPAMYDDIHHLVTVQLSRTEGLGGFDLSPAVRLSEGVQAGERWSTAERRFSPPGLTPMADGPYAFVDTSYGSVYLQPDGRGKSMTVARIFVHRDTSSCLD